jgi:dUTPase
VECELATSLKLLADMICKRSINPVQNQNPFIVTSNSHVRIPNEMTLYSEFRSILAINRIIFVVNSLSDYINIDLEYYNIKWTHYNITTFFLQPGKDKLNLKNTESP